MIATSMPASCGTLALSCGRQARMESEGGVVSLLRLPRAHGLAGQAAAKGRRRGHPAATAAPPCARHVPGRPINPAPGRPARTRKSRPVPPENQKRLSLPVQRTDMRPWGSSERFSAGCVARSHLVTTLRDGKSHTRTVVPHLQAGRRGVCVCMCVRVRASLEPYLHVHRSCGGTSDGCYCCWCCCPKCCQARPIRQAASTCPETKQPPSPKFNPTPTHSKAEEGFQVLLART